VINQGWGEMSPGLSMATSPTGAIAGITFAFSAACQLSSIRRGIDHWLESFIDDGERRDNVVTVANELATNVLRASPTGTLSLQWTNDELTVHTAQPHASRPERPLPIDPTAPDERGRGLIIVTALAHQVVFTSTEHELIVTTTMTP
jgi:anti-sigma regulatory factor (Ser/Thr protein kinase)